MTYKNRPIIRILLVSFILITSIYTFIQIFYFNHTTNTLKQSSSRFEDDYFYYSNSVWQHTNPTHLNYPHNRFKAAFYTFVKSDRTSLTKLRSTIRNLEDQFNKKYHYPYIIFSNEDLNEEFRELTSSIVADSSTTIRFEKVNDDLYGYGPNTDLKKAEKARNTLSDIMFGDNEDYRFQSRFMAGTIYRHPLMQELDYGWRFEAGTEYICPINEDPFQFMFENNKTTSFSMALYEYRETVPTLYQTVLDYAKDHIHWIQPFGDSNNLWHFILNENNKFNYCHFWNNFQIANLHFYKSEKYQSFFNYLDEANGIFYERWGDPIIQSLGAVLFLKKQDVHFWENIGYRVSDFFTHCPLERSLYSKCTCVPEHSFDYNGYSCLRFY